MTSCTYRFKNASGEEVTITGQAEMKAFLADGGLEQLLPGKVLPWMGGSKAEAIEDSRYDKLPSNARLPTDDPKLVVKQSLSVESAAHVRAGRIVASKTNPADKARESGFRDSMMGAPSRRQEFSKISQVSYDQGAERARKMRETLKGRPWMEIEIERDGSMWRWAIYEEGRHIASGDAKTEKEAGQAVDDARVRAAEKRSSSVYTPSTDEKLAKKSTSEASDKPFALSDLGALQSSLQDGSATVEQYQSAWQAFKQNQDAIKAELTKKTKPQLLDMVGGMLAYRLKGDNKPEIVKAVFEAARNIFSLSREYGPASYFMGEYQKYQEAKDKAFAEMVEATTAEDLKAYADKVAEAETERRKSLDEFEKAIEDPQTLDDFRKYVTAKLRQGMSESEVRMSLTPEQRARMDELHAEYARKSRASRPAPVVTAAAVTTGGDIVATKHTKTGEDLYVVRPAERVERDQYNIWNATAKRMGGWYSSFRGNGAVPGFQFKTRESADAFLAYVGGDTEGAKQVAQERRDAFADDRSQSAVERLTEMADRLEDRADESLSRDRKANTARRASMAASAEASANADKAMARTMRNIANAIKDGKAKFLDKVRQKVQVEMLRSFVSDAKYKQLTARHLSYVDFERNRHEPATSETADYATFPKYTADRADLARMGRELELIDGAKKLGQQLLKVADDVTDEYLKFVKENLNKVSTFRAGGGGPAIFSSRDDAERAIARSGFRGKAIVYAVKRGQNMVVMGPSMAKEHGLWTADTSKRITLTDEAGEEITAKIESLNRNRERVYLPHQFSTTRERRAKLKAMGIETAAEFRAALREFIALSEAPSRPSKVKELERSMVGRKNDGLDFFPTPAGIAQQMIEAADIKEGMRVLEPSAGMGHIAEQIRESGVDPDVVEFSSSRRELLEAKGFNVVANDFMEASGEYDRIIMNPPFSDRRDAQHVQHAYGLLKPGGRLVAIMGEGVFFGQDKKATEFREWLDSVGGTSEKLPDGSFLDPSLPVSTGANARMVVIEKAEGAPAVLRTNAETDESAVSRDAAESFVRQFVEKYPSAPEIILAESFYQLPADVQRDAIAQGSGPFKAKGAIKNGKVYVLRRNHHSMADMEATVFHEVLGHAGIRKLLGPKFSQELNKLFIGLGGYSGLEKVMAARGMSAQFHGYMDGVRQAKERDPNLWTDALAATVMTEEVFAHIAEQKGGQALRDRFMALVGMVRDWLRNHGFAELASLGESDILFMLQRARTGMKESAGIVRNGVRISGEEVLAENGRVISTEGDRDFDALKVLASRLGLTVDAGPTMFSSDAKGDDAGLFVPAPDGSIDFGEITSEMAQAMRRQAGKIRLERGDDSYGERHIELRHGKDIRGIGFDSVAAFVSDAVQRIDAIWKPSKTGQLVVVEAQEHGKVVFIELKPAQNGDYYTVNSAFPTPRSYAEKKEQKEGWVKLWDRMALQSSAPAAQSPSAEQLSKDAGESAAPPSGQSYISVANPDANSTTDFDGQDAGPTLLRTINTASGRKTVRDHVAEAFSNATGESAKTFNWWQRTVGSQYGKAKSDKDFGRVYDAAHAFLDGVSAFAKEASERAAGILPHLDTWRDVAAGANVRKQWADSQDYQAIAPAIFDGTLANGTTGKVWTDDQLRDKYDLNDKQIGHYREFRAAVDFSLETLAASEMARLARASKMDVADRDMGMPDALAFYTDQLRGKIDAVQQAREEMGLRHTVERENMADLLSSVPNEKTRAESMQVMEERQAEEAAGLDKATKQLEDLLGSFNDKARQIRKLQSEGYAPLMRFGQYTVDVVKLDDEGQPMQDEDGNPDRPFFGMFESEAEARKAEKILAEEYPGYTVTRGVLSTEANQLYRGLTPETAEMFARLLGTDENEAFQAYLKQAVANRSAMKRLINRMGVEGFATDVPRVLSAFITSNARLSSGNWYFGEMSKAVEAIPKHKGDVKTEAVRLMQYVQNPVEEAAGLRGFLFFSFLGGSIASALVNLTQTFTTTLPYLSQFGAGDVAKALPKAMALSGKMMKKGLDAVSDKDLKDALRKASDEGVVDPQEIHLLMAEAGGNGASVGFSGLAGAMNKEWATPAARVTRSLSQAWGMLFGAAEKYNRHVAFIAAWEVAPKGVDRYEFAKNAVTETQFDYTKASRPNWARGAVGATLFTFKTFSINYIEFMSRLPSRERAIALGVLFLLSGMSGAPGSDDLEDVVDTVAQKMGYNWNSEAALHGWLVRSIGFGGADFVERGISSMLPLDVSARLGMGNLIPGTAVLQKSNASPARDVQEFFGPAGSVVAGFREVFDNAGGGKGVIESGLPLLPKMYRDVWQALDMVQTGQYRDTKGRKVVDVDGVDALLKGIGFQPNAVAEPRRIERMLAQSSGMQRIIRKDISELWARGVAEQDAQKIESARSILREWNEKNPDSRIVMNPTSIAQRVRAMRLTSAERLVKATPKDMRNALAAEMAIQQ